METASSFIKFHTSSAAGLKSGQFNQKRNFEKRFDIRYSAVRCSAQPRSASVASLIIKKPCHFGVVSYAK
jgi:hypothetical protein